MPPCVSLGALTAHELDNSSRDTVAVSRARGGQARSAADGRRLLPAVTRRGDDRNATPARARMQREAWMLALAEFWAGVFFFFSWSVFKPKIDASCALFHRSSFRE
jgi:hypothetical protein